MPTDPSQSSEQETEARGPGFRPGTRRPPAPTPPAPDPEPEQSRVREAREVLFGRLKPSSKRGTTGREDSSDDDDDDEKPPPPTAQELEDWTMLGAAAVQVVSRAVTWIAHRTFARGKELDWTATEAEAMRIGKPLARYLGRRLPKTLRRLDRFDLIRIGIGAAVYTNRVASHDPGGRGDELADIAVDPSLRDVR